MKKLLLTALLASTALAVNAKEITFAMEPSYPPFELTNEKGEIIGFDVDIANAICKEIQATCHFKGQAFDSLITGLRSKHFDAAISAIDITEARAKQVSFSDPYYDSSSSFISVKGKVDDLAQAKKWVCKMALLISNISSQKRNSINLYLMLVYKMRFLT